MAARRPDAYEEVYIPYRYSPFLSTVGLLPTPIKAAYHARRYFVAGNLLDITGAANKIVYDWDSGRTL